MIKKGGYDIPPDCVGWLSDKTVGTLPEWCPPTPIPPPTEGQMPVTGIYEASEAAPYNTSNNETRVKDFTSRGFKLTINYSTPLYSHLNIPSTIDYGSMVAKYGGKVIWNMREYKDHINDVAKFVNSIKNNPGTYGYYVADEPPPPGRDPKIIALNQAIKAADPKHPTVVVTGWWWARAGECGSGATSNSYYDSIAGYADIIAIDYYPVGARTDCETADMKNIISQGYKWTQKNGKQWGVVLQSFSPSDNYHSVGGWPSSQQMTQWRNLVLENSNPVFIIWYSYFDIVNKNRKFIDTLQSSAFSVPIPSMNHE